MKKLIILLLTLTLILGIFASCQKRYLTVDDETISSPSEDTSTENTAGYITESNETNQTENTETDDRLTDITTVHDTNNYTYDIEKSGEKYYISFNEQGGDLRGPGNTISPIQFSSLDTLKYDIPNGNIDANTWRILWNDYITAMKMPLYDIEHIWQPKVPEGWTVQEKFNWGIEYYGFYLNSEDESNVLCLYVYTEERYNENFLPTAEECLNEIGTPNSPARKIQHEDITVYFYSTRGGDNYEILFSNGEYFGRIYGDLSADLTDEEILGFGLEEYLG